MITQETIPLIEKAFGFHLYDWQKGYLLGNIDIVKGGRGSGKTFVYCIKLLLSEGDEIKKNELKRYADEYHGYRYIVWFEHYCLSINEKLIENGFRTRINPDYRCGIHKK